MSTRSDHINVRVTPQTKKILQAAAAARRKSVGEFILDSAMAATDDALADRRFFSVSDEQSRELHAALDAPTRSMPNMQKSLREPGFFD